MTKKGNLFHLIKALTKSEKRYFKIFCFSEKTRKHYLQLFEAYEKMEQLRRDWRERVGLTSGRQLSSDEQSELDALATVPRI